MYVHDRKSKTVILYKGSTVEAAVFLLYLPDI